jgi:hypothetical protein
MGQAKPLGCASTVNALAKRCKRAPVALKSGVTGYFSSAELNLHGSPVERRHRVNDINHSRPRNSTRILAVVDQGGNHCAVDRADQRRNEFRTHGTSRPFNDVGDGIDALAQVAPLDLAQCGQSGTGDVTLVARNKLFGQPWFGFAPDEQVDQQVGRCVRAPATAGQRGYRSAQLCDLQQPDMGDGTGDQVVEAREVVGGRRQRKARTARNGAVTYRLEPAFTQQFGGGADQRVATTFSLGSDSPFWGGSSLRPDGCLRSANSLASDGDLGTADSLGSDGYFGSECPLGSDGRSHLRHGASQAGAALRFRINTQPRSGEAARTGAL